MQFQKKTKEKLMTDFLATGTKASVVKPNKYPEFFWSKNSGYGTKLHIDKIKLLGITPHHRKSFKPITKMIK